ncbi:hypothetical protein [Sphingomonas melonis]|uniref:Bacteriophage protein n=1 Tax=Sphingomonas melonis TaxID=152682 RepID=A0A7Y9FSD4_9SPHN|nr:hypothetical protein [Sphingomonas melonis]NYD91381.1 hypothetical protein [Sphingomonas melonis]
MATFNKFQAFVEALAEKQHNLQSDTLRVMLSNTAPAATNAVKADITEIAAGNGYVAGGPQATVSSSAQTSGTYKLVLADTVITASGGSIGPVRYAVLYNATSGGLIGFWDYGSAITLNTGETLTVDFDDAAGVLTLA